jgi:hypothetical protein
MVLRPSAPQAKRTPIKADPGKSGSALLRRRRGPAAVEDCPSQANQGSRHVLTESVSELSTPHLRSLRPLRRASVRTIDPWTHTNLDSRWEGWRRRPDLNRGWRFCRPLPYLLATAPRSQSVRAFGGRPSPSAESEGLERETGFEPATSTLARSHSTTELFPLDPPPYHHSRTERKTLAASSGAVGLM